MSEGGIDSRRGRADGEEGEMGLDREIDEAEEGDAAQKTYGEILAQAWARISP